MPSPGSYTDIFGGNNVYPSQPSYLVLNPLSTSVQLGWPIEQSPAGTKVVADLIDVNPTAPGLVIQFSDATQVSTGYTALFNNIGANSFNVEDDSGNVVATVASGTVWQVYLADNTTANGVWRAFQFGVGISQATAAALAGFGLVAIGTTLNTNTPVLIKNANYIATANDRASAINWTGGAGTLTLPNNATIPAGWFCSVKNSGSGVWTVSVTGGGPTIDGSPSLALSPEQSCILIFDGANFFTVGLNSSASSSFDFLQINLAGDSGDVVLSGAELNRIAYRFTGALAGNVNIVVPTTIQQYWVDNETSGAFSLTVKTATGINTVTVPQGTAQILYCDGAGITQAVTITYPVPIAKGGTGASTAPAALANLGAVPLTETISAGAGLAGGGDLSAPRTISLNFKGALVTNSTNQTQISSSDVVLAWNQETTDIGGWHDNVTNNSRLTVPAGVTVVELTAVINWEGPGANSSTYLALVRIRKNGAAIVAAAEDANINNASSVLFGQSVVTLTSGPLAVIPGDYFEVVTNVADTTGTNFGVINTFSSFSVKSLT